MGPGTGLDDVEKRKILPLLELEFHSQSPYQLLYPGSK
jgi:hypothetical protein